jgi:hypothetical protein
MKRQYVALLITLSVFLSAEILAQYAPLRVTNNSGYRLWVTGISINPSCSMALSTGSYTLNGAACGNNVAYVAAPTGSSSNWTWEMCDINLDPASTLPGLCGGFNTDSWLRVSSPSSCWSTYPTAWQVPVSCNIECTSTPLNPTSPNVSVQFVDPFNVVIW